jgi:malate synthase
MTERITIGGLQVATPLHDLIRDEIAPGTGIASTAFWQSLADICNELMPTTHALLERRNALQATIDDWHRSRRAAPLDPAEYQAFLTDIGYLEPEGPDFSVTTTDVDPEISDIAGPQLVVPVNNARYALNAANARWGSLYDALYGTDAIPRTAGAERGGAFNPARGERVVATAVAFLDEHFPIAGGASHGGVDGYRVSAGSSTPAAPSWPTRAVRRLPGAGGSAHRRAAAQPRPACGDADRPRAPHRRQEPAGVKDVVLESAVTAIQDCEDSVAAVDAEDKVLVYRNWLGLMRGDLTASFSKGGKVTERG